MLRSEYREGLARVLAARAALEEAMMAVRHDINATDLHDWLPTLAQASAKCASGDVRGARVRVENVTALDQAGADRNDLRAVVAQLRDAEERYCNGSGYINDPGDDALNGNKPGPPR